MPENNGKRNKAKPHKVQGTNKTKKNQGNKNREKPKVRKSNNNKKLKKHPKLVMFFKILVILFLLLCVIGAGIIAGMFFGLFGNEFEITKDELKIGASNSVIVDKNGGVITNLSGDEKRKIITLLIYLKFKIFIYENHWC